jgi:DNA-binding CsgD family transcriptional regulator
MTGESASTRASKAGTALVGREQELAALSAGLDAAMAGHGGVALLAGEPGIGKTRLAEELATEARSRGARVLWGRCYEGEGAPAFWPWVQILRAHLRGREPDALAAELGRGTTEITQLLPELPRPDPERASPPALDPAQARFRLFDAVVTLLAAAARSQPLVLVLDDLHWADMPSLLLLQFLTREIRSLPLLAVGTYRDVEVGLEHPLAPTLADLAKERAVRRVSLRGLSEPDAGRLMALAAGFDLPEGLVRAVHLDTEGNPFFIGEIIHFLATEGHLSPAGLHEGVRVVLPQTVREVIGRRTRRLSPEALRVLGIAAVVGREFGVGVLGRVGELESVDLLEALEEAEATSLVAPVPGALGRYRFTHMLIRETLYEGLPSARRVRLHRQVGEALEALHGGNLEPYLAELAHHFAQAAPEGDADKAITYATRAGDRAIALLAYEESVRLYRTALQALDLNPPRDPAAHAAHERRRCGLLLALADALSTTTDTDGTVGLALQAAEAARALAEPELLARASVIAGSWWHAPALPAAEMVRLLEEALAGLGTAESPLRARVLAALAKVLRRGLDPARSDALEEEALVLARRLGDHAVLADVLKQQALGLPPPDQIDRRLAAGAELIALGRDGSFAYEVLQAHVFRVAIFQRLGDAAAVDAEIKAIAAFDRERRHPSAAWELHHARAMRALLVGRFAESVELIRRAAAALPSELDVEYDRRLWYARRSAEPELGDGDDAELESTLAEISRRYAGAPHWRAGLAFFYSQRGRTQEAWHEFARVMGEDMGGEPRHPRWYLGLAMLAEVCAALGDRERAALLYDALEPHTGHCLMYGTILCYGAAARYQGLLAATLGRWEAAARHFEDALARNARIEARPWLARTQRDYAALLLEPASAGGDAEAADAVARRIAHARILLDQADETAGALGMARLAAQCAELRRRIGLSQSGPGGGRTGAAPPSRPESLTPREREIAVLIAQGLNNRQIADRLTISKRTADTHVTNILNRLGLAARAQVAVWAAEQGLLARTVE